MPREQFRDALAVGGLATYQFEINHNEEEGLDFSRNVEKTALTTGGNFVLQQGPTTAGTFKFKGTILSQAQYDAMLAYYNASSIRTVFFTDFTGTEYEVVITRFNPMRHRTIRNPRDPSIPYHYWTYDLEMEVVR